MSNKTIILTENQKEILKNILLEDKEGKNLAKARHYLVSKGYSSNDAQQVLNSIRTDIPNTRMAQCKFILGAVRLYLQGQLSDGHSIHELNNTLKYVASDAHVNEYDNNLNDESLQVLVNRFKGVMKNDLKQSMAASNARQLTVNHDYTIVPINNFEDASKYGRYTSWCITHDENMLNSYTANGTGRFYFCLRNGFENEPKVNGKGSPLDRYGLSMIAVSVDMEGAVHTITCRWNHDMGGNDSVMSIEKLENLLGRNFYQTFKPYTREELHAKGVIMFDEVQALLDSGKKPEDVFDGASNFKDGFACVKLNYKYNFINTEGKLLSDTWFDYVFDFDDGFAVVVLNRKYNFINTEGKIISDIWFDYVFDFKDGFARVRLNGKWNFINKEGKIISDTWFDYISNVKDGFAQILLNGTWYRINKGGKIVESKNRNGKTIIITEKQKKKIKDVVKVHHDVMLGVAAGDMAGICEGVEEETITLYHGVSIKGLEFNLEHGGFIPRVCSEGGPKAVWLSEKQYGYPFIFQFDIPKSMVSQLSNVDYIYEDAISFDDFNCHLVKTDIRAHYDSFTVVLNILDDDLSKRQFAMFKDLGVVLWKEFKDYPMVLNEFINPFIEKHQSLEEEWIKNEYKLAPEPNDITPYYHVVDEAKNYNMNEIGGVYYHVKESNLNESPDYIDFFDVRFNYSDAYPFIYLWNKQQLYIGQGGQTHIDVVDEIDQELSNDFSNPGIPYSAHCDEMLTGRYWQQHNVISFWKTPIDKRMNVRKVIDALKEQGIIQSSEYTVLDYWDNNTMSCCIFPIKWLFNVTYDMFAGRCSRIAPIKPLEYSRTGKYTYFQVNTNGSGIQCVNVSGNEILTGMEYYMKTSSMIKNDEGEIVSEKCKKCGGKVVSQIHGEPVYICKDCGEYYGTMPFTLKENKLNESWEDLSDIYEEYSVYDLLCKFQDDKEKGITKKQWNLIPAQQYHTLLKRYMYSPEMAKIPYNVVNNWFMNIIVPNALDISYITELAGHSRYFPEEDVKEFFERYYEPIDISGFHDWSEKLEELGFYDWCVFPDGSNAWSDYGIEPLFKILNEYSPNSTAEDILILINRCLDVAHQRGDMSSGFIQGGKQSCDYISNVTESIKKRSKTLNEENTSIDKKALYLMIYAKNTYGTTDNFDSCGFILLNGELLDFGNYDDIYRQSHGALDLKGTNFRDFINSGNIRVNPQSPGIEFSKEPTEKQYVKISEMIAKYEGKDAFYVDCVNNEGANIWNKAYKPEERQNIISDIKEYFNNGKTPVVKGNDVLCGYSLRDFIGENVENEIAPENVDLSSFTIKKKLNPDFWIDGHLDSRVRMKLLDIADDFIEEIGIDTIKPIDVIMTGSLANFNWNEKYSDIDLHIVYDFSEIDDNIEFLKKYFDSKKQLWNQKHTNLKILGFNVEVYVQDINEPHMSSGVYSLDKDKWLVKPDREILASSKVNKEFIKNKCSYYTEKIDELLYLYKKAKNDKHKIEKILIKADKLFNEIKQLRKIGFEKSNGKEINNYNILFKFLRRKNYLNKLSVLKTKCYDIINGF